MSSCRAMKHCTNDSKFVMVHVTCPSEQSASLARLLVTKKAAACVNIISNIRSIYRWQDKIEDDNENMLIIKTKTAALGKLSQLIKQHHPYELPEMIVTPIIAGLADYLNWIDTTIDNDAPDN